jgi:hypothetical protein
MCGKWNILVYPAFLVIPLVTVAVGWGRVVRGDGDDKEDTPI